jgi:hypothetical protein
MCIRDRVEAHDAAELLKGTRKGYVAAPDGFTWPGDWDQVPRGWCDVNWTASTTEVGEDLRGTKHAGLKLAELLRLDAHAPGGGPLVYAVLDPKHRLRAVMQTAYVRKLLTSSGVLKKPERKPAPKPAARPSTDTGSEPAGAATDSPKSEKPLITHVAAWEADERAAVIAAGVLREYAEDQCAALAELPDACQGGPVRDALVLVARAFVYDAAQQCNHLDTPCVKDVLAARFPDADLSTHATSMSDKVIDVALEQMTAPQLLSLLLQLAAAMELGYGPQRETGKAMLDWAELDWPNLTDQARRVLAGGESAEEKLDAADAEPEQTSAAFEGEWIGDLGLTREQCEAACVLTKWDKSPKEPVSVKPVQPNDGTALYVVASQNHQYGHTSFEAWKLYNPTGFAVSFPDRPTTLEPSCPDAEDCGPAADEARRNAYWGVRVRCGKAEYVIGPRTDARRLTTKEPAGAGKAGAA